jgi:FlgD Ig-like domain
MLKAIVFLLALATAAGLAFPTTGFAQTPTTCADVQTGSFAESTAVEIEGAIVTAVRESGASGGFWIQDPPSGGQGAQGDPFSGIFCFIGASPALSVGDSVSVTGAYIEFFAEQSELNMRDCFLLTGIDSATVVHRTGVVVPAPKQLTVCDLAAVASNTLPPEQWEGVLVQVDSVRVLSDLLNGEWSVEEVDGDVSCVGLADTMLVDDKFPITQPPVGTVIRTLTGVFDNTFGFLKLEPRGDNDIVIAGPLPAPTPQFAYVTSNTTIEIRWDYPLQPSSATNIANYSLASGDFALLSATLPESTLVRLTTGSQAPFRNNATPQEIQMQNIRNRDNIIMVPASESFIAGVCDINFIQTQKVPGVNDTSIVAGFTVCTAGVVTAGTTDQFFDDKFRFFIESTGGGVRSGLEVRNFLGGDQIDAVRGDSVRVAGLVTDAFRNTGIQILDFFVKVGTKPVPGPNVVTLAQAISEDYEGVFVRINPTLVSRGTYPCDEAICFFEVPIGTTISGGDSIIINDSDRDGYANDEFNPGDLLCFLQGPTHFDFGTRRIFPRTQLDICLNSAVGVEDAASTIPVRMRLDQNSPNPFNPITKISFGMSKEAPASLVIYDLSGRAVRTLVSETLKPGEYERVWDGFDGAGNPVASGIYFYKLETDAFNHTRKMVLLK